MNDPFSSEQRLVALRGLIERKDRYRAVFAPTAFVAGILSILTAAGIFINDEVTRFLDRPVRPREFAFAWLVVLIVTVVVGVLFLSRDARKRGETSGSGRMKLTLANLAPYLLIPAAFTGWFFATGYLGGVELDLVAIWIAFYGLVLLSTALFASRSIVLLGWTFLLTALSVPVLGDQLDLWIGGVPTIMMGVTFGFYHLVYAALNWRRG